MIGYLLQGISLGLVLAMMIGPVFFMILNTSLKKGFRPAAYMAAGVALSDAFFILIALFGSSQVGVIESYNYPVGMAGGILLVMFGLISIFKKMELKAEAEAPLPDDSKSLLIDTGKGFVLNTLNPFVLIFWIGVITALQAGAMLKTDKALFFGAVLFTVFTTDLLKAFLATRLKRLLTEKRLILMNRISGTGLVIFGLRLIYQVLP